MKNYGHFIGGKHVEGQSARFADVFEPMTGDVRGRVALATSAGAWTNLALLFVLAYARGWTAPSSILLRAVVAIGLACAALVVVIRFIDPWLADATAGARLAGEAIDVRARDVF